MSYSMKHSPLKRIFDTAELMAAFIAEELATYSHKPSVQHISLSGGGTPKIIFKLITRLYSGKINWNNLHFWWGDERCVPPEHEESNFGVAHSLLFDKVECPKENIHRMKGENAPLEAADSYAFQMNERLEKSPGSFPVHDWILLGMGTDGHTASLFPPCLPLDLSSVMQVTSHPDSGQKRITLGAGTICAARRVSVMGTGASKAPLIGHIYKNTEEAGQYPIYSIQTQYPQMEWLMDVAAAGEIN